MYVGDGWACTEQLRVTERPRETVRVVMCQSGCVGGVCGRGGWE